MSTYCVGVCRCVPRSVVIFKCKNCHVNVILFSFQVICTAGAIASQE